MKRLYPGRGGKNRCPSCSGGAGKARPSRCTRGHGTRERRGRAGTRPGPAPVPGARSPKMAPRDGGGSGGVTAGPRGAAAGSGTGAASAGQRQRINSWVTRGTQPPRGQRCRFYLQHSPKASLLSPPPLFFFFFNSPPHINATAQPSPPPSACPSGCHETWLGANKPPTYPSIYIAIVF